MFIMENESKSRIKINELLKKAGWNFNSNIDLEDRVDFKKYSNDEIGDEFEKTKYGFIDYVLLDENKKPILIIEAKSKSKNPLSGKEQARKYAINKNIRFVILSNGDTHYFWDTEKGTPYTIDEFYSLEEIKNLYENKKRHKNNLEELKNFEISKNLISGKKLRYYQINAIKKIKQEILNGKDKFLMVMATGTGKTLVSAGIIKMMLKTEMAKKILFLVDRLELEEQAYSDFESYFIKGEEKENFDFQIYKKDRSKYDRCDILITTIQSFFDRYKEFSKTQFDFIIADETHRSINGHTSRKVFDYFNCFKLGLTATPKATSKNIEPNFDKNDFRELEIRKMKDTYLTFGCENFVPTFEYTLEQGANDGFLVLPKCVNVTTKISTELLSEKGYEVEIENEDNKTEIKNYKMRDFERKFFSFNTNYKFCEEFFKRALRDPISEKIGKSGEIGKSIFYCVSQNHAFKIANLLNKIAMEKFPNKYNSDFAMVIVSSSEGDLPRFRKQFRNNKLGGMSNFLENYKTSKTRVCVTYGMMTTGYDCSDLLNIVMMRPIYSPSEFIQIKGRGTRTFTFEYENIKEEKKDFYLFDFFENCEYFEKYYDYKKPIPINVSQKKFFILSKETISLEKYVSLKHDFIVKSVKKNLGITTVDKEFYRNDNGKEIILTIEDFFKFVNPDELEKYFESFYDKFHQKATKEELFNWIFRKKEPRSKNEIIEDFWKDFLRRNDNIDCNVESLKKFFFAYFGNEKLRGHYKNYGISKIENFHFDMTEILDIENEIMKIEKYYVGVYG